MVRIANRRCLRLLAAQYLPPCGPGQQLAGQCRFTIRSARGDSATHSRSLTRRRSQSFDRASSDRCRPICRACSDGYGQRGRTVLDRCCEGIEQCRTPGTVLVGRSGDEVVTSRADRDISSSHRNIRTRRRGGWVRNQGGPGRADLDVDLPEPLRGGPIALGHRQFQPSSALCLRDSGLGLGLGLDQFTALRRSIHSTATVMHGPATCRSGWQAEQLEMIIKDDGVGADLAAIADRVA